MNAQINPQLSPSPRRRVGIGDQPSNPAPPPTIVLHSNPQAAPPPSLVICQNGVWDPSTQSCVPIGGAGSAGGVIGSGGPGSKVGGGTFTWVTGHRATSTTASSGGPLPAQYANVTQALLQTTLDQALPGYYTVVSVAHPDANTFVAVLDYKGPNKTVAAPVIKTSGSVTITSSYQDQGASPAASSSKTVYYVAGGLAAAALAAAGYWKYGRKRR